MVSVFKKAALILCFQYYYSLILIYFQRESQRADEYVRTVKDQLDIAVSQCIQAAGHEFEPSRQRELLKVRCCCIHEFFAILELANDIGKCFLSASERLPEIIQSTLLLKKKP